MINGSPQSETVDEPEPRSKEVIVGTSAVVNHHMTMTLEDGRMIPDAHSPSARNFLGRPVELKKSRKTGEWIGWYHITVRVNMSLTRDIEHRNKGSTKGILSGLFLATVRVVTFVGKVRFSTRKQSRKVETGLCHRYSGTDYELRRRQD